MLIEQSILSFGTENIETLMHMTSMFINNNKIQIEVLYFRDLETFNYVNWNNPLNSAIMELEQGKIATILVHINANCTNFHIFCPNFCNSNNKYWHGCVDLKSVNDFTNIFSLCSISGLNYLSLSLAEDMDLENFVSVTVENFPWEHDRLLFACVSGEMRYGKSWKNEFL